MPADFRGERRMEIAALWVVFVAIVAWWANAWGRSVGWAIVGSLILSPLIWAVVLLVLGRNTEAASGTATDGRLGPVVGSTACPQCRASVKLGQRQVDAGSFQCPHCGTVADIAAKAKSKAEGPARIRDAGGPNAAADCPGCGAAVPIAFDDAKAGKATCPQCWRSFEISAG